MKKARLLPALILALLFLLPAGCGKPAAAQPTPNRISVNTDAR